ncbi:uncharacterized protein LOC111043916 isoform X2 [Nilaparvata lugens]|uniref:uncharacterized protein LOC111043916 isoform X2 n=1 Tax=Nilaparvata lugens TaxID=108931 RepID=UPI00193E3818|nr:uncharacterized protein LOC111043916 isoform X2 [Nilaparvata lugens]
MYNLKLLRRAVVPAGVGAAATLFTVSAAKPVPPPPPPADCDPSKTLVRPRDLPIYSIDPPCLTQPSSSATSQDANPFVDVIAIGRREILASLSQLEKVQTAFWDTLRTGKAHTEASLAMLRDEDNATMRYGAIGGGAFVGLLLSARKGKFKKLLYMSTFSLAVASLCYPEEASVYSADAARLAKRYANIAYHFAVGGEPDLDFVDAPPDDIEEEPVKKKDKKAAKEDKKDTAKK